MKRKHIIDLEWSPEKKAHFRKSLIDWFRKVQRPFPWRKTRDPYHIFLAEIMLQQTQTERVLMYYEHFLKRFPDIESLACADLEEVLRVWQGLGYYRRARYLHESARKIVLHHRAKLPENVDELIRLPGIGPYTARAIASIAYHVPCAVVDGNVVRVLSRLLCIDTLERKLYQTLADELIDQNHPGDFNQAMMELGSILCLRRAPMCSTCPVQMFCEAFRIGKVHDYPPVRSKKPKKHMRFRVFLIQWGSEWIVARKKEGLLADMWLFPMIEMTAHQDLEKIFPPGFVFRSVGKVTHTFSHRIWDMEILYASFHEESARPPVPEVFQKNEAYSIVLWLPWEQIRRLPMPSAHRKVFHAFLKRHAGFVRKLA